MSCGKLYLIPVPLAEEAVAGSFTPQTIALINEIDEYIVENEKTARKMLKLAGIQRPQSELILHDYGKHTRGQIPAASFLKSIMDGRNVGLMSEAGCPGVADPGAEIVAEAHRRGIPVVPLVGPSSILLALMASGLNGQSFTFHGYLPIDKQQRSKRIKELERESVPKGQTHIMIETPFRNNALLEDLLKNLNPKSLLCVAVDLTGPTEQILTSTVHEWRISQGMGKAESQGSGHRSKGPLDLHKRPAIFLFQG
ncbi:MAG TPA: SAM-dependent methyltransferase [Sphingobacteriaceae bacterium]|nr:SAM-dependent methyltransferase [Sphingobacteriaceae bacterium]